MPMRDGPTIKDSTPISTSRHCLDGIVGVQSCKDQVTGEGRFSRMEVSTVRKRIQMYCSSWAMWAMPR